MTVKPDQLIFLPLGGSGEIGMNLNLYCCAGQWIMVDLGINFADLRLPGIDLMLPDPTFIEERAKDLIALVLTHGHEDHIGAVPYLWPRLRCPIYATPFTAELVKRKLAEVGELDDADIRIIKSNKALKLGPFKVTYLPIAHSIAEGNALLIDTAFGRIFHTGDWKLDERPEIGTPTPPEELIRIGDKGVLALVGDSTNVFNRTPSGSEAAVAESLLEIVRAQKRRVVISTFASNVARIQTVGRIAKETGRHLAPIGRSMNRIIDAARATGYLKDFPPAVDEDHIDALDRDKVLVLATGCQGEPIAALARIASGEHRSISLSEGDTVIFSSKIIPGNEIAIGELVNDLTALGAKVITEKDAFVHVSGHPSRPELKRMYEWIRPEIAVPVHGELRHMTEHARLARKWSVPKAIVPHNGGAIRLAPGKPQVVDEVPAGRWVVDGTVIEDAESDAVAFRRRLAFNGTVVIALAVNRQGKLADEPGIVAMGVPGLTENSRAEDDILDIIDRTLAKLSPKNLLQERLVEEEVRISVRRHLRAVTGKNPLVAVRVVRAG